MLLISSFLSCVKTFEVTRGQFHLRSTSNFYALRQSSSKVLFTLLGSAGAKAAHVKLTPSFYIVQYLKLKCSPSLEMQ